MRRLKQRLDRLEAASPTASDLSITASDMLVSVYGRLHAMFHPVRSHRSAWAAVRSLRRDYLLGTSGISARSPGAKDWVSGHDARRELVTAGLAVAVRGNFETTGLILTPLGRSTAWQMVAPIIPSIPLAESFTEALRDIPADRVRGEERWVSESSLFGIDCVGNSSGWQMATDVMIEPCVSGAVDSLCDVVGTVYYRWLKPFEQLLIVDHIEVSDRACDLYCEAFVRETARLQKLDSVDGEICIPLSAHKGLEP